MRREASRRRILELLRAEGDLNADEIWRHFDIMKPSLIHHLNKLRESGLVISVRKGRFIRYSLNRSALRRVEEWLSTF